LKGKTMTARSWAFAAACALAIGCGSSSDPPGSASDTNRSGDPQWGDGFGTRVADGGDPDAPSSAAQACALLGGDPWDYPSIDDVTVRLTAKRWIGCGENSKSTNGFWPAGFAGVLFDADGTWQALVRTSDGSIGQSSATGTFTVDPYGIEGPQYVGMFIVHLTPSGVADPAREEQWQGYFEDSPEILFVESSTTSDPYRFSSAPP
jgi:hypothetical protein